MIVDIGVDLHTIDSGNGVSSAENAEKERISVLNPALYNGQQCYKSLDQALVRDIRLNM